MDFEQTLYRFAAETRSDEENFQKLVEEIGELLDKSVSAEEPEELYREICDVRIQLSVLVSMLNLPTHERRQIRREKLNKFSDKIGYTEKK